MSYSKNKNTIVIGIAGGTGSGKTTVSNKIIELIGINNVAYLQQDSYYKDRNHLSPDNREKINFDHPSAFETSLMVEHIKSLKRGIMVKSPIYDYETHTRKSGTLSVKSLPILLIEGILVLANENLRKLMDIKVFVETDSDTRFIRRLKRDITERGRSMESVIYQYENSVKPMHSKFVEPSKRYANIIIQKGGFNNAGVNELVSKIRSLLPLELA